MCTLMSFLSQHADGAVSLHIHVQPQASKNKIVGLYDGRLKIAVAAPPVEGKANDEVVRFLAKFLRLARKDVVIQSGRQSKRKKVLLRSLPLEDIRRRVEAAIDQR